MLTLDNLRVPDFHQKTVLYTQFLNLYVDLVENSNLFLVNDTKHKAHECITQGVKFYAVSWSSSKLEGTYVFYFIYSTGENSVLVFIW